VVQAVRVGQVAQAVAQERVQVAVLQEVQEQTVAQERMVLRERVVLRALVL
jgi:hypothetical protein